MNGTAAALALALGLTGPAAETTTAAPMRFELQAEIRDGGAVTSRPRLIAVAGEPATILIANEKYSLRVTATAQASAEVSVDSLVTSWSRAGLVHQDKHTQLRADGMPAALHFTRIDPATGEARQLVIDIEAAPVAR